MNRKAVLLFANPIGLDLARRRWPRLLRPLFSLRRLSASGGGADLHLFTSGARGSLTGFRLHEQRGATFAERLDAATEDLALLGYDEIVVVGSDCPKLTSHDIATAFRELEDKKLVLGPDHRGGCYLIALHASDRSLLHNVRWNRNGDYAQLRQRVGQSEVTSLSVKQDVDSWADVNLLAQSGHWLAESALAILQNAQSAHDFFVDLSAHASRVRSQRPPPVCLA